MRKGWIILLLLASCQVRADIAGDGLILMSLGHQLEELKEHFKLLQAANTTSESQLSSLNDLKSFNSGSYGFGALQNSLSDLRRRQGSNTWDEALQNLAGGNPARYAALAKSYDQTHTTLTDSDYLRGASDTRLKMYKQNTAVNKAVTVQTTEAFNNVNKHLEAVHILSAQIEGEKNKNTKSAIDLNTRLLVEMAYIQTDLFRLQALIGQQAAQAQANEIAADTEAVRFNRLPSKN